MIIYQISGLGSNQRAFERLDLNPEFDYKFLPYLLPEKEETLEHYAIRMASSIDKAKPFALMGLSFGGILAQEINRLSPAEHCILISTVKTRKELPSVIRLGKNLALEKWFPTQILTKEKGISYSFFRDKFLKGAPSLNEFFTERDPYYLRWSMDQVTRWSPNQMATNFTHIHGSNDLVFPHRNIADFKCIEGGSHLMVLQKPKLVSEQINLALTENLL